MRVLAQNKLLPVRVRCSDWTAVLHLGDHSAQSRLPGLGPSLHPLPPPHTESELGTHYVQLYLEGSSQPQQITGITGPLPACPLSPRSQEHKIPPGPQAPARAVGPKNHSKNCETQPWFVAFILFFFIAGLLWQRTIDWTQNEFQNKTTHQRVKLMQFGFCFEYFLIYLRGRGGRGASRKEGCIYRGPTGLQHRLQLGPVWVTPALASGRQGNDLGDVSPFQRMFPSCDPALAWESVQDRLQLSLPSRAASGQGLPSRQAGEKEAQAEDL